MKKIRLSLLLLATLSCCAFANTWTSVNVPGATGTVCQGIDGKNIVGSFSAVGNPSFIYDGTTFSTINRPGASSTDICGIDGNMLAGNSNLGGFIYDGANWNSIYGHVFDIDNGNVVGYYYEEGVGYHGFISNQENWSPLDVPGASHTFVQGIDGDNIVGYTSGGHAFLYDGIDWTLFHINVPGIGYCPTYARGIDGNRIVGSFYINQIHRGFLYDGTNWTILDYPGAEVTIPWDIDGDNIVGYYREDKDGTVHGFIYTIPEPATFALLALGSLALRKRK